MRKHLPPKFMISMNREHVLQTQRRACHPLPGRPATPPHRSCRRRLSGWAGRCGRAGAWPSASGPRCQGCVSASFGQLGGPASATPRDGGRQGHAGPAFGRSQARSSRGRAGVGFLFTVSFLRQFTARPTGSRDASQGAFHRRPLSFRSVWVLRGASLRRSVGMGVMISHKLVPRETTRPLETAALSPATGRARVSSCWMAAAPANWVGAGRGRAVGDRRVRARPSRGLCWAQGPAPARGTE